MRQRALKSVVLTPTSAGLWWLFGVRGLVLRPDARWVDQPLFGDATFLLPEVVRDALVADERVEPGVGSRVATILGLEPSLGDPDTRAIASHVDPADCFLAVRRTGAADDRDTHTAAFRRAHELLALVGLMVFASNPEATTVAFSGQFRDGKLCPRAALSPGRERVEGYGVHPFAYYPMALPQGKALHMSPAMIDHEFRSLFHRDLWDMAVTRDSPMRDTVLRAAVRIFDSIHASSFDSRLLGSVTAIEILIGDQAGGWRELKRRTRSLLGPGEDVFRADEVWSARHDYVHQGGEVEPVAALLACGLATSVLFHVAALAGRCKTRAALAGYLDLLAAAQRSDALWEGLPTNPTAQLRLHLAGPHMFPWLPNADLLSVETAIHPDS